MTFVHGKNTFISIGGVDLSAYASSSDLTRKSDKHDVTTYGKNSHVYFGGLGDGEGNVSGVYDNSATVGPRAVIRPLIGTIAAIIRRPEGTGAGRPQDAVNALIEEYVETAPVADMVTWSVKLQLSDEVTSTTQ